MANYTREELEGMRRSEVRTLAVSDLYGMSPKEAVNAATKDLIEFILSKQGTAPTAPPAAVAAPAPEVIEEEVVEPVKPAKSSKKDENAIVTRIDKLGLALDEVEKKLKEETGDIARQVYVLMAMVDLMLRTTDLEPSHIDETVNKANESFGGKD